ncbi:MAG: hypothetical protein KBF78_12505 [Fuscovulum sp.]|nr:hypothetical protein [Fuscovulum sp.]
MKKTLALAAALTLTASVAFAGGPVVIQDDPEVIVTQKKSGSGMLLPLILGVAVIAAVAGGDGT